MARAGTPWRSTRPSAHARPRRHHHRHTALRPAILALLVLLLTLLPAAVRAQPDAEPTPAAPAAAGAAPTPRRTVIYGGDADFRYFEWLDGDQPRGFHVELIRAIGREAGLDVEVRLAPWPEIRGQFLDGQLNVVALWDQPERYAYADFCEPHTVQYSQIFVRQGRPRLLTLDDLAGKRVLVQAGALAAERLQSLGIAADLVEVPSEAEAIRRLDAGGHDAAVVTQTGGRMAIRDQRLAGRVIASSPPVLASSVAFAVRSGDDATRRLINQGLARLKASGQYDALYDKYFAELERPAIPLRDALAYLGWVAGPLLGLLAATLLYSRRLRRKVDERTAQLRGELAERRRAEAALRESDERFRVALACADIMVAAQDLDLRYTWVHNPGVCGHLAGAPCIGHTDEQLNPSELATRLAAIKRDVIQSGRGRRDTIEVPSPTGKPRVLEYAIEPSRAPGGVIDGVIFAAADITSAMDAELRRAELERRLAIAQKLESLGLLAGGVAHDFNNLLMVVSGNASMLEQEVPTGSRASSLVAGIQRAADTAAELTHNLLAYTGRGQVTIAPVDAAVIVRQTIDAQRSALPPAVRIEIDTPADVPPVPADGPQLKQVVLNLLVNAADAAAPDGVVRIRTSVRDLDAAAIARAQVGQDSPPGSYVGLEVADTGRGMDHATLGRVFDPFFTTKKAGRGLGLAVIAGIIRRHHGVVAVASTPGQGTTFHVYLPLAAGPAVDVDIARTSSSASMLEGAPVNPRRPLRPV